MEKRAYVRIDASLPINYFCENILYSGKVKNLSENGMFISTSNFLPCDNRIDLFMPLKEEMSKFPATIIRIEKINDLKYNIGVELLNPPQKYFKFVNNL
jgi:hypothetical protein